jgi:hypothetical protein
MGTMDCEAGQANPRGMKRVKGHEDEECGDSSNCFRIHVTEKKAGRRVCLAILRCLPSLPGRWCFRSPQLCLQTTESLLPDGSPSLHSA